MRGDVFPWVISYHDFYHVSAQLKQGFQFVKASAPLIDGFSGLPKQFSELHFIGSSMKLLIDQEGCEFSSVEKFLQISWDPVYLHFISAPRYAAVTDWPQGAEHYDSIQHFSPTYDPLSRDAPTVQLFNRYYNETVIAEVLNDQRLAMCRRHFIERFPLDGASDVDLAGYREFTHAFLNRIGDRIHEAELAPLKERLTTELNYIDGRLGPVTEAPQYSDPKFFY